MFWWALGGVCVVLMLRAARREAHPVRALLAAAVCGLAALGAVNALDSWTGVSLPVNPASCFISGTLGVPGVILMLVMNLLP